MANKNFDNNDKRNQREEEENLERAQNRQDNVEDAENNPQTSGPADSTREKAAEMNDEDETSKEPA